MKSNATKQRLQELAAINNPFIMNEAVDPNFPVNLTITVKAGDLIEMFGGEEGSNIGTMDANQFKQFTDAIQDDLNDWFVSEGGNEWVVDGVESGRYDDLLGY